MLEWIVVLHVLSGAAWFGGQVYVEGLMAAAARSKDSAMILSITDNIVKTSVRIFSGSAVLLLITGVWIVLDDKSEYAFEDMFVSIGFLIVLIGLGVMLFYFRPKGAALKQAVEQEGATSNTAIALARQLSMVSHIMTLLITIALVVMVIKPGL